MVQEWAEMANGMRRPNQRLETTSWTGALSISWRGRNAALGWSWSDRRQPHQHWQTPGPRIDVRAHHPPATGWAWANPTIPKSTKTRRQRDRAVKIRHFAPESRLVPDVHAY